MAMTATQLRADLYRVLDSVVDTGEPIEVVRRGRRLRIEVVDAPPKVFRYDALEPNEGVIVGDPDDLVRVDFGQLWDPDKALP